jgi:hypothetical protein
LDELGYWISLQENSPAGFYAGILDIIAKKTPRGVLCYNIYIVDDGLFNKIYVVKYAANKGIKH